MQLDQFKIPHGACTIQAWAYAELLTPHLLHLQQWSTLIRISFLPADILSLTVFLSKTHVFLLPHSVPSLASILRYHVSIPALMPVARHAVFIHFLSVEAYVYSAIWDLVLSYCRVFGRRSTWEIDVRAEVEFIGMFARSGWLCCLYRSELLFKWSARWFRYFGTGACWWPDQYTADTCPTMTKTMLETAPFYGVSACGMESTKNGTSVRDWPDRHEWPVSLWSI